MNGIDLSCTVFRFWPHLQNTRIVQTFKG